MAERPLLSVVIPTLNGGPFFRHVCLHLARTRQRYSLDTLIIDSGSRDGTPELAESFGFRVHRIRPEEYGHGRTRNLGIRMAQADLVVMMTQDVLPCTPDWPAVFARAFEDPKVAGAYGRQVPRNAATAEMYFVARNYPAHPIRYEASGEVPRPGRVLLSDAFSVLRREVALAIPYVDVIPVSEDQVWARQVLAAGYAIEYVPAAEALHAHNYTLRSLYRRTYYVGAALRAFGMDQGVSFHESVRFLVDLLSYFVRHGHAHRLPQLLPYEFVRWFGFQMGRRSGWQPAAEAA